jgi:hypothetical protein
MCRRNDIAIASYNIKTCSLLEQAFYGHTFAIQGSGHTVQEKTVLIDFKRFYMDWRAG